MGGNRSLARGIGLFVLAVMVLGLAGLVLAAGAIPAHRADIMLLFMPLVGVCIGGLALIWLGLALFELVQGLLRRGD